jgi:hypothetical protein
MLILYIILLIVGFLFLIKGADWFIDGASSLAANFKVPKMIIALTIVAFGTSAPELAVGINSMIVGKTEMVLGNVIGSNILNVLVKEDYLYTILTKENNYKQVLDLLRQIEDNIELNYILKKKPEDKMKINLERLKNIFGEDLIIK